MSEPRTIVAASVQLLVATAMSGGLPVEELLAAAAIEMASLADPDAPIPFDRYLALWEVVATRFPGHFPTAITELLQPEHMGVLGYAMAHSPNYGESLQRAHRFSALIGDVFVGEQIEEGERVHFRQRLDARLVAIPSIAEATLLGWTKMVRLVTGTHFTPLEITFQHTAPDDLSPYAWLGCPVQFARAETRMTADRSLLSLPVLKGDARLTAYLDRHAEELVAKLPRTERTSDRVRALIAEELRGGDPSQARIAKRMALSERTLQRRLRDEGVVFSDLVDDVRRALAERYLGERTLAVYEVAFLLGYAEPSAFHRAFRRWTGTTPNEWRAAQ